MAADTRHPVIVRDVEEALSGLQGWFDVKDLHPRYCERARANGREPAERTHFSYILKLSGYAKRYMRGRTCFLVLSPSEPFPGEIEPVTPPRERPRPDSFYTP